MPIGFNRATGLRTCYLRCGATSLSDAVDVSLHGEVCVQCLDGQKSVPVSMSMAIAHYFLTWSSGAGEISTVCVISFQNLIRSVKARGRIEGSKDRLSYPDIRTCPARRNSNSFQSKVCAHIQSLCAGAFTHSRPKRPFVYRDTRTITFRQGVREQYFRH